MVEKTKKLKIGNGMEKDVNLGPLTTKKRLEEIEQLVETTKKRAEEYSLAVKDHLDLIKDTTMSQLFLTILKMIYNYKTRAFRSFSSHFNIQKI